MTLVTTRPAPRASEVQRLYIEDGCDIARELYLGMLVDRATGRITVDRLDRGRHGYRGGRGQDARRRSSRSRSIRATGLMQRFHARKIAFALGLEGDQVTRWRQAS